MACDIGLIAVQRYVFVYAITYSAIHFKYCTLPALLTTIILQFIGHHVILHFEHLQGSMPHLPEKHSAENKPYLKSDCELNCCVNIINYL